VRLTHGSHAGGVRDSQEERFGKRSFSIILFICIRHVTLLYRSYPDYPSLPKSNTTMTRSPRRHQTLDDTSVSSDLTASNFGSTSSSFLLALASEPGSLSSINRLGGTIDQSPTARMTGRYSKQANIGSFVAGPLR